MSSQHGLTGDVLVNAGKRPDNYKGIASYIMQDDALVGSLTVKENLFFAAMLKLPHLSFREKLERVEEVISELGLTRVKNTKVGTPLIRGISGGERRRCSIGVELIRRPKLLFADEITSGLDSHSSYIIIKLLRDIARNKCCSVIMTIHQPSSPTFKLFDGLMLLSKGQLVYLGPAAKAIDFFGENGLPCDEFTNPADHMLDQINYDFQTEKPEIIEQLVESYDNHEIKAEINEQMRNYEIEMEGESKDERKQRKKQEKKLPKYGTNIVMQTIWLTLRMLLQYLRDPAVYWARIVMYTFLALVMGTLYLRIDNDMDSTQDRNSVLFFSIAFLSFMSVSALPAFIEDRQIFTRERMNGTYRVLPYATAQTMVSVPFVCAISVLFTAVSYYMIGLSPSPDRFFIFMLVLALALNVAEAMIIAISAIAPNFIAGLAAGAGSFGGFMLVCGFFLLKKNIPDYWIWAHYLSFEKYGFEALMKNEYDGAEFDCAVVEQMIEINSTSVLAPVCQCAFPDLNGDCLVTGDEVLQFYEYEDVNIWAWCSVLLGMAIFFRLLFFMFLRFFNKGKR